jgi:uncharacterized SAM-binding protein YcdF (DUF218 family)
MTHAGAVRGSNTRSVTAADRPPASDAVIARDIVRLAVAAVIGTAVVVGYTTFRIWQQGGRDEKRPADAIVVLGAAEYNGTPSPVFRSRLDHAVDLYRTGVAPWLVVTGGRAAGDRTTEAAVARAYALAKGIPASAILVEDHGRATLESLQSVGQLLQARGLHSAVFVSDRSHMLRVMRIANDQGLTSYGSPTSTSPADADARSRFDATVHELGALALYYLAGAAPAEELAPPAEATPAESSPGPSPSAPSPGTPSLGTPSPTETLSERSPGGSATTGGSPPPAGSARPAQSSP